MPTPTQDGLPIPEGTTLRQLLKEHPEYMDHTIVVYTGSGHRYVGGPLGGIYPCEEMQDVPGKDCAPTGRTVLVFSV